MIRIFKSRVILPDPHRGRNGILWFIDKTRLYAVAYVPFVYIVVGLMGLLLFRFAWSQMF